MSSRVTSVFLVDAGNKEVPVDYLYCLWRGMPSPIGDDVASWFSHYKWYSEDPETCTPVGKFVLGGAPLPGTGDLIWFGDGQEVFDVRVFGCAPVLRTELTKTGGEVWFNATCTSVILPVSVNLLDASPHYARSQCSLHTFEAEHLRYELFERDQIFTLAPFTFMS